MLGSIDKSMTVRDKKVIFLTYSVLVKLQVKYCAQFLSHYTKRYAQAGKDPKKGHRDDQRAGLRRELG